MGPFALGPFKGGAVGRETKLRLETRFFSRSMLFFFLRYVLYHYSKRVDRCYQ